MRLAARGSYIYSSSLRFQGELFSFESRTQLGIQHRVFLRKHRAFFRTVQLLPLHYSSDLLSHSYSTRLRSALTSNTRLPSTNLAQLVPNVNHDHRTLAGALIQRHAYPDAHVLNLLPHGRSRRSPQNSLFPRRHRRGGKLPSRRPARIRCRLRNLDPFTPPSAPTTLLQPRIPQELQQWDRRRRKHALTGGRSGADGDRGGSKSESTRDTCPEAMARRHWGRGKQAGAKAG